MKTKLTQKELLLLTRKYGLSIHCKMPKKHIMLFVEEAIDGNNDKWLPMAKEVQAHILYEFFGPDLTLEEIFKIQNIQAPL
jgi:hypothetical protein